MKLAGVSAVLSGDKGCRPFPRTPFSARDCLPSLRSGQFSLTKPNTFPHNRGASVATLRDRSPSARNAVRLPFGISVHLRRNPQFKQIQFLDHTRSRRELLTSSQAHFSPPYTDWSRLAGSFPPGANLRTIERPSTTDSRKLGNATWRRKRRSGSASP